MMNFDPYEVLGVGKDASADDIRKAYRKLARKHHPDVNPGDKGAEDKFKQLSEAYDILGDETKRAEYDRLGQQQFYDQAFDGGGYERPDFGTEFRFEDMFGDLFGGGAQTAGGGAQFHTFFTRGGSGGGFPGFQTGPQRGGDLSFRLGIGFREAIFGTEKTLEFDRPTACGVCHGAGVTEQGQPCPACGGRGQAVSREKIKARIPAGVDNGSRVRLAGKGHPGPGGGPAGDLYLEIEVEPDPVFRRDGRNILVETDITMFDAALGGKIEVPTLTGRAKLTIPPGTQNGRKFRLKGKGVAAGKNKPAGDLLVSVRVLIPESLTSEAREEFEKLKGMVAVESRQGVKERIMPRPIITISQVSRRLGISIRTIRAYEEEGFITPERSSGRCLLDPADIEMIAMIERIKADLGVNLAGVGVILEMRRKMVEMQERLNRIEADFERHLREALEDQRRESGRPPAPRGGRSVMVLEEDD